MLSQLCNRWSFRCDGSSSHLVSSNSKLARFRYSKWEAGSGDKKYCFAWKNFYYTNLKGAQFVSILQLPSCDKWSKHLTHFSRSWCLVVWNREVPWWVVRPGRWRLLSNPCPWGRPCRSALLPLRRHHHLPQQVSLGNKPISYYFHSKFILPTKRMIWWILYYRWRASIWTLCKNSNFWPVNCPSILPCLTILQ